MGILSPFYDATFSSVSFWEQSENAYRPGQDVSTSGTLYSIGNGDHVYIDMGQAGQTFTITAAVEGTQLTALDGKRGVSGSLVWSRGTQTATLLDIKRTPGKVGGLDAYKVQLVFFSSDTATPASTAIITEGGDVFITEGGDTLIQE